jgi:hypothetical protein
LNPCIICFAIKNQIAQDVLLDQFGATALLQAQKEHDDELHNPEAVKAE